MGGRLEPEFARNTMHHAVVVYASLMKKKPASASVMICVCVRCTKPPNLQRL